MSRLCHFEGDTNWANLSEIPYGYRGEKDVRLCYDPVLFDKKRIKIKSCIYLLYTDNFELIYFVTSNNF